MANFNRFDFEQQIMSCWNVTSDIKDVSQIVSETDPTASRMLLSLCDLYEHRFTKLFSMFESMVREQKDNKHSEIMEIYGQAANAEAEELSRKDKTCDTLFGTDIIRITGDWANDMCEVFNLAAWNGNMRFGGFTPSTGNGIYVKFLGGHDPRGTYIKLGEAFSPLPNGGFQHKLPPSGTTHVLWYPY